MGLESATYVNDLVTTNPASGDLRSQGDDHLRLIKTALKTTFPNADRAIYRRQKVAFTSNDTIDSVTEVNALCTMDTTGGGFTLTLPSLAAGDAGYEVTIKKIDSTSNLATIGGTIEGLTNYILYTQYEWVTLEWSGSIWAITAVSDLERTIAKTADATLTTTQLNATIVVTPASANTTLTLPTAVGIKGKWYKIKRTAFNFLVTLDGNGSQTIDGALTYSVFGMQWIRIVSDGANWFVAEEGGRPGWGRPGTIQPWVSETAPTGAVLCYGQAISRTAFADAFAAASTVFGTGDGSTTWNVPDIRGRVVAGVDDMGGSSANRLTGVTNSLNGDTNGATGGSETRTLTTTELPAHTHSVTHGYRNDIASTGSKQMLARVGETTDGTDAYASSSAGTGSAFAIVQPTIAIPYIMWT